MRQYLNILLAVPALLLSISLLLAFWSTVDCIGGDNQQCSLLQHQFDKLDRAPPAVDLIFLGDSSLGRAVDADLFATLSGQRVLNLALTGNYNVPSMHNLLVHATKATKIRRVVLMLTPQVYDIPEDSHNLEKHQAFPGVIWSLRLDWELLLQRVGEYRTSFVRAAIRELFSRKNVAVGVKKIKGMLFDGPERPTHIVHDYLPPRKERMVLEKLPEQFAVASRRYLPSLYAIGKTCRDLQIQCLYLHGTVFEKSARNSAEMIEKINAMVQSAGLILVDPAPIPIPFEEIGDSVNHVDPPFKSNYTELIFNRLRSYWELDLSCDRSTHTK